MPGQRLPMRKIRDVLRLTAAGMSSRKIAASLVVGATTVVDCLQRARAAGVSWPLLDDLSDEALERRLYPPSALAAKESRAVPGLRLNEHIEADGPTVFAHACKMGLEGIVSKRKGSSYRSGRSRNWLKSKNPACAAVKRESEEDWAMGV